MTPRNPILEEIYAARKRLLAEFKGDVHAYIEDARQRALALGRPIATPKPRQKRSISVKHSSVLPENQSSVTVDR